MRTLLILCVLAASCWGQGLTLRSPLRDTGRSSAAAPTPDIAWWQCNEGSGDISIDGSTRGTNNLWLSSASMWTTGKAGGGITGNGTTFFGQCTNILDTQFALNWVTNFITMTYWIKDSSYTALEVHFEVSGNSAAGDAFVFYNNADALVVVASGTTGNCNDTFATPSTGVWHHMGIVVDSSTGTGDIKIYYDGVEQVTTPASTKTGTAHFKYEVFMVMCRGGTSLFSDAQMDDIRIYSGDRSADMPAIVADPR